MEEDKIKELREKILSGFELAYKKLIQRKSNEDGELIYSQNGQIVRIKAKDLLKR